MSAEAEDAVFRLVLEYDGTDFEGWQAQRGAHRTVQGCLREALEKVTGSTPLVTGAGRTDAGVHAEGQVASVRVATGLPEDALRRALNAVLPADVAVPQLVRAPDDYDAQRAARAKCYRYRVWNGPVRSPRRAREWTHIRQRLDLEAMAEAARQTLGEHDFTSFQAAGSSVTTTVRRILTASVEGEATGAIEICFVGTGFLRHMVRNLVGTLLEVGQGKRPADSIGRLLHARDRSLAGPTAPARGLCLVWVDDALVPHAHSG